MVKYKPGIFWRNLTRKVRETKSLLEKIRDAQFDLKSFPLTGIPSGYSPRWLRPPAVGSAEPPPFVGSADGPSCCFQ